MTNSSRRNTLSRKRNHVQENISDLACNACKSEIQKSVENKVLILGQRGTVRSRMDAHGDSLTGL